MLQVVNVLFERFMFFGRGEPGADGRGCCGQGSLGRARRARGAVRRRTRQATGRARGAQRAEGLTDWGIRGGGPGCCIRGDVLVRV